MVVSERYWVFVEVQLYVSLIDKGWAPCTIRLLTAMSWAVLEVWFAMKGVGIVRTRGSAKPTTPVELSLLVTFVTIEVAHTSQGLTAGFVS